LIWSRHRPRGAERQPAFGSFEEVSSGTVVSARRSSTHTGERLARLAIDRASRKRDNGSVYVVGKVRLCAASKATAARRWWDAAYAAGACAGRLLHAQPGDAAARAARGTTLFSA